MTAESGRALYREFTNQAEIDQQYDPARNVPDLAAVRQHYAQKSEEARRTLRYLPGVPYGPTLEEYVDIFPAEHSNSPVLVFLHGGYWRANTAKDFSCIALGPAALGMTVVVVNYALCPWVSHDEITRQVRASIVWVLRNIDQYNGDPSRLIVAGHSAGAHLAAMCLQTRWSEEYGIDDDSIRAALMVSGVFDIAPLRFSYLQPAIQLDDGIIRRNSPMFGICPSRAQVLLTWGSEESSEFARQSSEFFHRWQQSGNSAELIKQAGCDHFSAIYGFEDPQSMLCQWLKRR